MEPTALPKEAGPPPANLASSTQRTMIVNSFRASHFVNNSWQHGGDTSVVLGLQRLHVVEREAVLTFAHIWNPNISTGSVWEEGVNTATESAMPTS